MIANPWSVLGVHRKSTLEEIKARYRQLAAENHPDKGGDADKAAEIASAYKILTTPALVKSYIDTLTVLGTVCTQCWGKGYISKQLSLTERALSACARCGGAGMVRSEL